MTSFLRPSLIRQLALLLYVVIGFTLMSSPVLADTPFPSIHKPSDESLKCIAPNDEMRRNHMNYIMHERDETMHNGIRNEAGSLAACIDCHVEPNANGKIADFGSNEHFCSTCHEYTSVQIDCFQCHADRPQKYINHSEHSSLIKQQLMQKLAHSDKSKAGIIPEAGVNE